MATSLRDTSVGEIERRLDALCVGEEPIQRTTVLTHMAWVPPEWSRAAERVMEGLGARVPSRTLLLHPDPGAKADRLDAEVEHECFPGPRGEVCAEIVHIWLRGCTARAPASVVVPLHIPDLPVFLRWRGRPPFGAVEFEQLVGVSDRLVVDSGEWAVPGLRASLTRLAETFDRIVVSDLAWARTLPWRAALAELWPGIRKARVLEIEGPKAEAVLIDCWLRSRLRGAPSLRRREGRKLARVEVDGERIKPLRLAQRSASDLLSDQLEQFVRDPVYEAAVRAV
ncbi:MAG TPA: glucose-6-phosphate dehydrogenase assembly protein OpcA [Gaiellaceae bacterium]|nr:glucose-6-phosphate dehydrogenase assembly protein OpcA [Gaiellaceae bacterium]